MSGQETVRKVAEQTSVCLDLPPELAHVGYVLLIKGWIQDEGAWWLCSFAFHLVLVCSLALISGRVVEKVVDEAPSFEEAKLDKPIDVPQEIERFEVGDTPEDPTELNADTLSMEKPAAIAQEDAHVESPAFSEKPAVVASAGQSGVGGLGGFDVKALGARATGKGRVGAFAGAGIGARTGSSNEGWGFGGRGSSASKKAMLGSGGGTRQSERSVAAALNWLARHQLPNGSWSFTAYKSRCKDGGCTGNADTGRDAPIGNIDTGATAMALLPFFAAGQTHETRGRYKKNIYAGVSFLIKNQKPNGDLRMMNTPGKLVLGPMYAQGLATIALCECYAMSGDKAVGQAAQAGLNFIMQSQDPLGGGWRYEPRERGDMSVTGWMIMAMKSGMIAYLTVNPIAMERAKLFLQSVSSGRKGSLGTGGLFGYMNPGGVNPALTAIGLLCSQYMGVSRTDPAMIEGTAYLMKHQPDNAGDAAFNSNHPDNGGRNIYYWYYGTQVMHNQPGPHWDIWNRKIRRILIDTQCKEKDCAAGSWDPNLPKRDEWADYGGRLYLTSLSALTLEVYYRYLPLYKLDAQGSGHGDDPSDATKPEDTILDKDNAKAGKKTTK